MKNFWLKCACWHAQAKDEQRVRGMKIMLARQTRAAAAAATADSEEAAKRAADAEVNPPPPPQSPDPAAAGSGEPEITPAEPLSVKGAPEGDGAAVAPGAEQRKKVKKFRWAQPEREVMPAPEAQPFTWRVRCGPVRALIRIAPNEHVLHFRLLCQFLVPGCAVRRTGGGLMRHGDGKSQGMALNAPSAAERGGAWAAGLCAGAAAAAAALGHAGAGASGRALAHRPAHAVAGGAGRARACAGGGRAGRAR